jgi:hypothetical protein
MRRASSQDLNCRRNLFKRLASARATHGSGGPAHARLANLRRTRLAASSASRPKA